VNLTKDECNVLLNAVAVAVSSIGEPPPSMRTSMISAVRKLGRICGDKFGKFPLKELAAEVADTAREKEVRDDQ
jgi:hypothetical protein